MKKIIKEVDEKKGIVQVTIADERWYVKPGKDKDGIPAVIGVPSVTWIAGKYPKGIQFYKWLADKGWDEAEAIRQAAGDKGSKVHLAIGDVLKGLEVRIDSKYPNPKTGEMEELTLEECDCILSFIKWFNEVKPKTLAWEVVVFSQKHNYAGTIDYICQIGDEYWVIDFKTSQQVWTEYELQISAYRQVLDSGEEFIGGLNDASKLKTAILQIGYRRNKDGYKFTEIENKFDLFLAAQKIWRNDHGDEQPNKKDYPIILSPALTVDEALEETKVDIRKAKTVKK